MEDSLILRLLQDGPSTTEVFVLALSEANMDISRIKGRSWDSALASVGRTLAFLTGKVSAMVFVQRLNQVTLQVQELEKDKELSDDIEVMDILSPTRHKHELNVWKGFMPRVKIGVFFECNVAGVFHLLERTAVHNLSSKTARALTKNVASSAIRKSARSTMYSWSTVELFDRVFSSTFRAQTLYWSALFIVSVAFDAVSTLNGKYNNGPISSLFVPRYKIEGPFVRRTWMMFVDCTKKCLLTAIGASIGSLIRPGIGTTLGMVFLPSLAGVPR